MRLASSRSGFISGCSFRQWFHVTTPCSSISRCCRFATVFSPLPLAYWDISQASLTPTGGGVSYMLRFLLCACGTLAPFPPTDTKGGQNSPPSDYRQAHQRTGYAAKADGLMSQSTRWVPRRFLVSRGSRWLPFCGDHQPYHCVFACVFHQGLPRFTAFLGGDLASEGWIAQLLPPLDSVILPHVACLCVR